MYLAPAQHESTDFPRLETAPDSMEVYVRAHDAGGTTYLTWQWHDDPDGESIADHAYIIDQEDWAQPGTSLDSALITGGADGVAAALNAGGFSDKDGEHALATELAKVVLPVEFWEQLQRAVDAERAVRMRLTPSQRLAPVPWELLVSPVSGERLLRMVSIVYEAPYTVHWSRARQPESFQPDRADKPLYTIDVAVKGTKEDVARPVLNDQGRARLALDVGIDNEHRPVMSRGDLSTALKAQPTRWLYVGHVSSSSEVGLAAIHLSDIGAVDPFDKDGAKRSWSGIADLIDSHRPLTARDLHLGTTTPRLHEQADTHQLPAALETSGADIWPMPSRVAFVACASVADHASSEIFGLATAALASGAEWVIGTRWVLPTDHALHQLAAVPDDELPLVDLVLAVDQHQQTADPGLAIREWQLDRLDAWERDGQMKDSPILWASLMTYWMPSRPELKNPEG